jgi:Membrane proteins related to metalloendopeptidases
MIKWIADLLLIAVISFVGYSILIGVERRQIANLVLMVATMLSLLITMQDLTPVIERWGARIDSLQDTADKIASIGRGSWKIPMPGNITQGYNSNNHGIDIAGQEGTPVKAAKEGEVLRVDYNDVYGNFIVINHGGGIESLYGHLSGLSVKVGYPVVAGTQIGSCGNTGNSTGPHLHFEIRKNGTTVDPLTYLK